MEDQKIFKVSSIQRHRMMVDGEGVTSLIALANCPLKCEYCLNKEFLERNQYATLTAEQLLEKVLIDYCYFVATGGGLTFGGGESLLHYQAIDNLFNILPPYVNITLETSLNVPSNFLTFSNFEKCSYIIDVKTLNKELYKKYTGKSIDNLLKNLNILVEHNMQDKCVIRIPNIKNYTTKEDIDFTIEEIKKMGFTKLDIFDYLLPEEIIEHRKNAKGKSPQIKLKE